MKNDKCVFSCWPWESKATNKATELKDQVFDILEDYFDRLYDSLPKDYLNLSTIKSGRGTVMTYRCQDERHVLSVYVSWDYEDYNGVSHPFECTIYASDPEVEKKLRNCSCKKLESVYNELVEELERIRSTL